ncbi:MAG: hypothetical protein HKO98_12700 [Gemmatimonadetes bacterium]|nr:hypothetical protein [Gemmatimonadota bacterium]
MGHRLAGFVIVASALAAGACGDDPLGIPRATSLEWAGSAERTGLAGVPLADSVVVVARGPDGPLAGVVVSFTASAGGAAAPAFTVTNADGRAATLWTPAEGPDSVIATANGPRAVLRGEGTIASASTIHRGRNNYIEYRAGTLPIVVSAPHGGTLLPDEIPDRTAGVTVRDRNTELLAEAVAAALEARLGGRPHLVVSYLHRRKLDPNREIGEAAGGDPRAEHAWWEFQNLIEHAQARVVESHGTGLYLDLHGHGHPIARIEWGYLLDGDALALSDEILDQAPWPTRVSIRRLVADNGAALSELLRGPDALGSLLEDEGFPGTPSDVQPGPGGAPFFSGGYNTRRHGSADGGPLSGVQIEAPFPGVRETAATREAFAAALAKAVDRYLQRWY